MAKHEQKDRFASGKSKVFKPEEAFGSGVDDSVERDETTEELVRDPDRDWDNVTRGEFGRDKNRNRDTDVGESDDKRVVGDR